MDPTRFADKLRSMTEIATGRRALGGALAAAAAAAVAARLGLDEAEAGKKKRKKRCRNGTKRCGARCTNLQNDRNNCGQCGVRCGESQSCIEGGCVGEIDPGCGGGETDCDGVCQDLQNDPANCGACGAACGDNQTCSQGFCISINPGPGAPFNAPRGIAVGSNGIAVADTGNDLIAVFPNGGGSFGFGATGSEDGQFVDPSGVSIAGDGRIFVADTGNHRIQRFAANGRHELSFGFFGNGREQFQFPRGVFVEGTSNVWVVDSGVGVIKRYNLNMIFLDSFAPPANDRLNDPSALVVGADRNDVFVVDTGNNRVVVFDRDGNVKRAFGRAGAGNGEFDDPRGIAVGANGNVFVTDAGNSRVQEFTPAGAFVSAFGFADGGEAPGSLSAPDGIAIEAGGAVIHVVENGANRVSTFTTANRA